MRYLFCLFFIVVSGNAFALEIHINGDSKSYLLWLSGEVQKGDYEAIKKTIKRKGSFPMSVTITSAGGNVMEAMQIGRFIRKMGLSVISAIRCNSSCVLIWAGGVERTTEGAKMGLHRPFYPSSYFSGLTPHEANAKYLELENLTRSYLIEMNFPITIIDKMMATKSTDVYFVPPKGLEKMVGSKSPAHQEWIIAKCGELTDAEESDWEATISLRFKDISEELALYNADKIKYAETLSPGYREYLTRKFDEISRCEANAMNDVRKEFLKQP